MRPTTTSAIQHSQTTMATDKQLVFSDLPVSPGSVLQEEIEARGVTADKLATLMGRATSIVTEILQERAAVTPDLADAIEAALGINSQFWLNLEAGFRATLAHNELGTRQGPNHTCDLGLTCSSRIATTHDQDETYDEKITSANILMDEG